MRSLANPSAASRTIFARMTSLYGDVYLRARAVSSSRSLLFNSMTYGLRRGPGTSLRGVCQIDDITPPIIRHHIYEHEYLGSWPCPAQMSARLWSLRHGSPATPKAQDRGGPEGRAESVMV